MRKEKIATFCNVYKEDIVDNPDLENVYQVPDYFKKQDLVKLVQQKLNLEPKKPDQALIDHWQQFVVKTKSHKSGPSIAIVGKYFQSGGYALEDAYVCVIESLRQAYFYHGFKPNYTWLSAEEIEQEGLSLLKGFDGLVVPQGWGSRGVEGKILTAQFARENRIPYLGLCFGMQMAVIEFARNVAGLKAANSTEIDEKTPNPVICILPEQDEIEELGGTLRLGGFDVVVKKGSLAHRLYGKEKVRERFRHRFNVNTKYIDRLEEKGLLFSGMAPKKRIMQIAEIPNHPFFVGTQFHPEFVSRPLKPSPIFLGFIKTCIEKSAQ